MDGRKPDQGNNYIDVHLKLFLFTEFLHQEAHV